jgi:hypothetical protein
MGNDSRPACDWEPTQAENGAGGQWPKKPAWRSWESYIPPSPSPPASVVQSAPPPCSSWKDSRHGPSPNSPSRALPLTLPDLRSSPLPTARACAPTPVVSPFLAAQPDQASAPVKKPQLIPCRLPHKLQPRLLTVTLHPPWARTNIETPKQIP